jgi:hypothetical protein
MVLDIEIAMNNRSLCYLDDDVQLPVLTPNPMLHTQPSYIPELEKHHRRERCEKASQKYVKMQTSDVESVHQRICAWSS